MRSKTLAYVALLLGCAAPAWALEKDVLTTSAGDLEITFIGHGSLMLGFQGKVIHVDPYSKLADYSALPKADLVLITHGHRDHLDPKAITAVGTPATEIIVSPAVGDALERARVLGNGEATEAATIPIEAVPAYNIEHRRESGEPFHPRGAGNGYVLTFGTTRVYVAGDTENTPEMKALENIDIAFLPMNLPYTMTPEMVADAARAFRPRVLYPYHYGETDPQRLVELLAGVEGIEVRIRPMR